MWKQAVGNFLRSGTVLSLVGGAVGSGSYVMFKDYSRYERMIDVYETGNILPPLAENHYEITFCHRPGLEERLKQILNTKFTNEYYLINGEVGTGKTRILVELVREMMENEGSKRKGAPIYISVAQGKSFPDTLATAVRFHFDEHISYQFFLDCVMRISSFPSKDQDSKLTRVLNAIEESSFRHLQKTGRPVVLVLDGVNGLSKQMPGALEKIQDKAKLWADTNTVKVIFIINDEETEMLLHKNSSSWSRIGSPLIIDDLTKEEAITFLTSAPFLETTLDEDNNKAMSEEQATKVFNFVGGRMVHLVVFKREFVLGKSFEETANTMREREREKFISVSRTPSAWYVVRAVRNSQHKCVKLSKIIKETSPNDVAILAKHNIIRYLRDDIGALIKFQSPLTENVVEELQQKYEDDKAKKAQQKSQDLVVSHATV